MKREEVNLDQLKGKNPFKVPVGYMEGLTDQIMQRIPEKEEEQIRPVFFMDRVRPWLYMAAVFIGLGLFFKAIVGIDSTQTGKADSVLLVQNHLQNDISLNTEQNEEEDYLDYLEAQYVDILMDEEFKLTRY